MAKKPQCGTRLFSQDISEAGGHFYRRGNNYTIFISNIIIESSRDSLNFQFQISPDSLYPTYQLYV